MSLIKSIANSIWLNHRKKFIAFVLGLLFAAISLVTGIPLGEIKDAATDAASGPSIIEPVKPAEVAPVPVAPVVVPPAKAK